MSVLGPCVPFDRGRPMTDASEVDEAEVDEAESPPATGWQR
jgi:hypothetical protein